MDLDAVRTFVAVADEGRFHEAAAELGITQQAVSKRIAALETQLGVRLFTRTARGALLTIDGQAFLPHARAVLDAVRRAADSVHPGRRALRVHVLGRRIAPTGLLQDFHRRHPDIDLDVVTLPNAEAATAAVHAGTIDAAFHTQRVPASELPGPVATMRVYDEPLELLVGPAHDLAAARTVTPAQLAGRRIWMPGNTTGSEWAGYYEELAADLGLVIDIAGPHFGVEHLVDMVSDSASLATLVGARTRLVWTAHQDLRRIPLRHPTPIYPHSLIWRTDNTHPALATLREYLGRQWEDRPRTDIWSPSWA
ncbi:DNA-binding transcriptional regulator, LysR family [Streptoalloteichus tenebrarius]|uniref:DNA-binding transcriptional regulator, LysR family n=1 Tax=Streptoalloteichus tenebrarius (strain ATCC 17920 / DSM 40477 / JCM 4838 / CBS 697.72 / NBRC 16177 / NCIMB 11028 / NRRL B-12390 / A12253. 1 / ISP 5477) TaxID=1933 RepID=A0ABT1I3Z3_STRSD|nr:LysR family transcriptional regulator [Streptoalloteichus tenebrarius]MCP2262513.1 DNA-binding transcriptional regulator, LysR family [Streptoalloteichus tenebrarius]BFE99110.1 LysR family transcriptional regulator [Streptoalloteichus tenebrarius]